MKFLQFIILSLLSLSTFSQTVFTKDGVELGDRSNFINSCIGGFDKDDIDLNGITVNKYKYCSCVCDNLIPEVTSDEILMAMKTNDLSSLFLQDQNLKIIMKCVDGNMRLKDDFVFKENEYSERSKKLAIQNCVNEVLNNSSDYSWTEAQADEYCECAIEKMYDAGMTFKDAKEATEEDSRAFNEIVIPCMNEVLNNTIENHNNEYYNTYNKTDIIGNAFSSEIVLIDYLGLGFKIKIEIDGITKYFLFDTGAADLIIDRDFERDLLINGSINKDSYLGKNIYIMANNEEVEADMLKVNRLKLGDYVVNNVIVAVIDEGGMLCGKSLFDKFRTWEFYENDRKLLVYK